MHTYRQTDRHRQAGIEADSHTSRQTGQSKCGWVGPGMHLDKWAARQSRHRDRQTGIHAAYSAAMQSSHLIILSQLLSLLPLLLLAQLLGLLGICLGLRCLLLSQQLLTCQFTHFGGHLHISKE